MLNSYNINKNTYTVTAINETFKTNLNTLQIGDKVNLKHEIRMNRWAYCPRPVDKP